MSAMHYSDIPDLQGRRFQIEYAEPTEPNGYPVSSQSDYANDKYPVPDIVDQLPTNIIQHVRSSNNIELKAALEPTIQPEQNTESSSKIQATIPTTTGQASSTLLRHTAQPKQKVHQSRSVSPETSSFSLITTCSSDDEP